MAGHPLLQQSPDEVTNLRRSARLKAANLNSAFSATGQKRAREETSASRKKRRLQEQVSAAEHSAISHWCETTFWPEPKMNRTVIVRQRSTSRKRSVADSGQVSSSNGEQQSRDGKSAAYRDTLYESYLRMFKVFVLKEEEEEERCLNDASIALQATLENFSSAVPDGTLFSDRSFAKICRQLRNQNEPRVIRDIGVLMAPSPGQLAAHGESQFECFAETVNEAWSNCIPLTKPRPQPDFSVGIKRDAFTTEQLEKLRPLIGEANLESCVMATYDMLFPFFTCEVKCGNAALDIADRQNLHSGGVMAIRLGEFFQSIGRIMDIHGEFVAFSLSHNDRFARIYGYIVVVNGNEAHCYRQQIREYSIADQKGRERWTSYKFVRNVFEFHGLPLLTRLRSAIDKLPKNFGFGGSSPQSRAQPIGLSQELSSTSIDNEDRDLLQPILTPDTSNQDRRGNKKHKKSSIVRKA